MGGMGLPAELYWSSTAAEINAIAQKFWEMQDVENRRAGTIAAMVLNARRTKRTDRFFKWQDLCPPFTNPKKRPQKRQKLDIEAFRIQQQELKDFFDKRKPKPNDKSNRKSWR